jgi:hypothetical protein
VKREAIATEVGGGELSIIHDDMVGRYAEVDALLGGLTKHLIREGILTKGGRTRASFRAWQAVFDRWQRLAAQLGTERRPKLAGAEQLHDAIARAERDRQAQRSEAQS